MRLPSLMQAKSHSEYLLSLFLPCALPLLPKVYHRIEIILLRPFPDSSRLPDGSGLKQCCHNRLFAGDLLRINPPTANIHHLDLIDQLSAFLILNACGSITLHFRWHEYRTSVLVSAIIRTVSIKRLSARFPCAI